MGDGDSGQASAPAAGKIQRLSSALRTLVYGEQAFDLEAASMERARMLSSMPTRPATDVVPPSSSSSPAPLPFWGADLLEGDASTSPPSASEALELWSGARETAATRPASSGAAAPPPPPSTAPAALFAASLAGAEAAALARRRERDEEAERASAALEGDGGGGGDEDDPLAPKRSRPRPLGASWLRAWITRASGGPPSRAASEADDALATAVARVVLEPGTDEERLAAELFDLVGAAASFDSIRELVERRRPLASGLRAQASAARAEAAARERGEARRGDGGEGSSSSSFGPGVSVATAAERAADKALRKASRRAASSSSSALSALDEATPAGADRDVAWIASRGVFSLADAEDAADAARRDPLSLPGGLVLSGEGAPSSLARALPQGTKRVARKGYEEIFVPAPRDRLPPDADEPLVPISALPAWARPAFAGMSTLNRIQSRIFRAAFSSNVNLLVCAPTGAGKTNIAMLTVLRECGAHLEEIPPSSSAGRNGSRRRGDEPALRVRRGDVKVVYVAPMKALAAEVTAAFSRRLAPLGLTVRELTGDTQLSRREMEETNMIVTTPEKWDVVTRKGGEGGTGGGGAGGSGASAAAAVRLLIIDEVHLLNDDRGAVIETLVARTHRAVEAAQVVIRVVGLSATLPNHKDVAAFLGAPAGSGVFHFDARYRPVPLDMTFVGISTKNQQQQRREMDDVAYERVVRALKDGHQAMVFVHSRKDTGKTARALLSAARARGEAALFDGGTLAARRLDDGSLAPPEANPRHSLAARELNKSRDRELQEVASAGVGLHHAGMLRADRSLVERLFSEGSVKVLCCTATLAWGVNLPAHCVVIKGTQLYDPQAGGFKSLGLLDVQQIFGRAGRPQFDTSGDAAIVTTSEELPHFLSMLTHQVPIESRFVACLADNLNAEVVLGTVSTVAEGAAWLGYTYLFVRMLRNPLAYGITWAELASDPRLESRRRSLVSEAAKQLEECRMVRYDERSGALHATELGRIASHFYVTARTVVSWAECLRPRMDEADFLAMLSRASEFDNVALRDDEAGELEELAREACPFDVRAGGGVGGRGGGGAGERFGAGGQDAYSKVTTVPSGPDATSGRGVAATATRHGKVSVLLQSHVSRARPESFSLVADANYVSSNAPRLCRAAFEILVRRGWPEAAELALSMCKAFDSRTWPHQHPLRQVEAHAQRVAGGGSGSGNPRPRRAPSSSAGLTEEVLGKLEERSLSLDVLAEASPEEIGAMLRHPAAGEQVAAAVRRFPHLELSGRVQPLARGAALRLTLSLVPRFEWSDRVHGSRGSLRWHVWVEDEEGTRLHHAETWTMTRRMAVEAEEARRNETDDGGDDGESPPSPESPSTTLVVTLPAPDPLPSHYYVRAISDEWAGAEVILPLRLRGKVRTPAPAQAPTEVLGADEGGGGLDPLPVTALDWPEAERALFPFESFNPLQTQAFHSLYHSDASVLFGAPAGSGKTVAAELAVLRSLRRERERREGGGAPSSPPSIAVYLSPIGALVRERAAEWRACGLFSPSSGFRLVELSGDADADEALVSDADVVVATPEAWDLATARNGRHASSWEGRVGVIIVDDVHLLGGGGGGCGGGAAALEAVVTSARRRRRAFSSSPLRFVALSSSLADAESVASWLGAGDGGAARFDVFNFGPAARPSYSRPSPTSAPTSSSVSALAPSLEAHIQGYPARHYLPRMASMNRPTYSAIVAHCFSSDGEAGRDRSDGRSALVFVSSRRQTRATALDLVACAAADDNARRFLGGSLSEYELEATLSRARDPTLRHCLSFGVGLHHGALCEGDRELVERLFHDRRAIRVVVATSDSTLAWGGGGSGAGGRDAGAHLVVVKGTERYDASRGAYADVPVADVLQMMGSARSSDSSSPAVAVVMVAEAKKAFYKRFLCEPLSLESSLADDVGSSPSSSPLADALVAEVASGLVASRQGCVDYLTWTFFYRRLLQNPSYYGLDEDEEGEREREGDGGTATTTTTRPSDASVARRLSSAASRALRQAASAGLVALSPSPGSGGEERISATDLGEVAAGWCLGLPAAAALGRGVVATPTATATRRRLPRAPRFGALLRLLSTSPEICRRGKGGARAIVVVGQGEDRALQKLQGSTRSAPSPCSLPPDSPEAKASLLVRAALSRSLPRSSSSSYSADLCGEDARGCLRAISSRLVPAAAELAARRGLGEAALAALVLRQCLAQGLWPGDHPAKQLVADRRAAEALARAVEGGGERRASASDCDGVRSSSSSSWLDVASDAEALRRRHGLSQRDAAAASETASRLPRPRVSWKVAGVDAARGSVSVDVVVRRGGGSGGSVGGGSGGSGGGFPPRAVTPRSPSGVVLESWELLAVAADGEAGREGGGKVGAGRTLLFSSSSSSREKEPLALSGETPTKLSIELSLPSDPPFATREALATLPVDLCLVSSCYVGVDAAARLPPLGALLSLSSSDLPSGEGSPWSAAEVVAAAAKEEEEEEEEARGARRRQGGGEGSGAATAATAGTDDAPAGAEAEERVAEGSDVDEEEDDEGGDAYGDDA